MTKVTNVLPTGDMTLNSLVSEAFVQFFVEVVGHYSLHMSVTEKGERVFQREPFRKSHGSRNVRHFLHFFMETQMFAGFIQDRELSKNVVKGSFGITLLFLRLVFKVWCHVPLLLGFCHMEQPRALLITQKNSIYKTKNFCISPFSWILQLTHTPFRISFHGLVNHDATC